MDTNRMHVALRSIEPTGVYATKSANEKRPNSIRLVP